MKCYSCGKEVRADTRFCVHCGANLTQEPAQAAKSAHQMLVQPTAQFQIPPDHYMPNTKYVYTYGPQATPGGPQVVYVKTKLRGRGFGVTSLILGIIGLLYVFSMVLPVEEFLRTFAHLTDYENLGVQIPDYTAVLKAVEVILVIGGVMPLLALIFGICSRVRGYKNGISMLGMVTGFVGIFLIIIELATIATHIDML